MGPQDSADQTGSADHKTRIEQVSVGGSKKVGGTADAGFAEVFGGQPEGVWSAPGRVNLIGEHTDYNQGLALPMAIDRRTYVAARRRTDRDVVVVSAWNSERVEVSLDHLDRRPAGRAPGGSAQKQADEGWAAYPLGVAWALGAGHGPGGRTGVELFIDSNVPVGAGLSSSAALEMAVAGALVDLWGLELDTWGRVRVAHLAENAFVGAPTGILDQVASGFGRRDSAVLLDCRDETVEEVPLGFAANSLQVLVIDTKDRHANASRSAGAGAGGYAERRRSCETAARRLRVRSLRDVEQSQLETFVLDEVTRRRARHVVTENERVLTALDLLREGRPAELGPLLVESQRSMKEDFEISTPALDLAVSAALDAGALGARLTGAGFGGSAIALVDTKTEAKTESKAESKVARHVRQAFAGAGYTEPDIYPVTPSAGAGRDS